ncbi:GFA family protein [Undibacterium fentianense]|uniref:GFA family protein n=1 Tax=Undibacterium fentianense TaxID=2828728 RepID=A0A941E7W5_9BURK|nr:GFA family protein [Undibacterium fentianense]MBR7801373.1 GFA family protein [Undibacterium fentianense]
MLSGTCLCGAVNWRFPYLPDGATACNCTACRRYGVLWAYDYENAVTGAKGGTGGTGVTGGIVVTGRTQTYVRGKALEFHSCPVCSCVTHWRGLQLDELGRRRLAVNLRLAEPAEVAQIPIDHFDGLISFEDLPRDGKCVADYWF